MPNVIDVEGLRKSYGHTLAVADVSFNVEEGEIFGLLGPNGAGKTTTVECLQGLRRRDAGEVKVLGLDPAKDRPALRRLVGSQLQESGMPDKIKVWEALDLFASFVDGQAVWPSLMADWGLDAKATSTFTSLSGGQKQRLLVALALVNRPRVVFLDEMTTGLDPAARRVAWDLVRDIRARGATVVLVTHFMDEAERLCDRLAIVDRGRVVALDAPSRLVSRFGQTTLRFSLAEGSTDWLKALPHVVAVEHVGRQVEVVGTGPVVVEVGAALAQHSQFPEDLSIHQPTLEDAFLALTGAEMRE